MPIEEVDLLQLFQKEKKLNCRLASMRDSITTEWDNTNYLLEKHLSSDMPIKEKANMLKVRNANLIRMFQSFDDMNEDVKMALNKTEQLDEKMIKRITALKTEVHKIELQKIVLFENENRTGGAESVARFRKIYETILAQNCEEL